MVKQDHDPSWWLTVTEQLRDSAHGFNMNPWGVLTDLIDSKRLAWSTQVPISLNIKHPAENYKQKCIKNNTIVIKLVIKMSSNHWILPAVFSNTWSYHCYGRMTLKRYSQSYKCSGVLKSHSWSHPSKSSDYLPTAKTRGTGTLLNENCSL